VATLDWLSRTGCLNIALLAESDCFTNFVTVTVELDLLLADDSS